MGETTSLSLPPFRRPWADLADRLEIDYPYYQRGPHTWDRSNHLPGAEPGSLTAYGFYWAVGDYVSAILEAGCEPVLLDEWGRAQ